MKNLEMSTFLCHVILEHDITAYQKASFSFQPVSSSPLWFGFHFCMTKILTVKDDNCVSRAWKPKQISFLIMQNV